MGKERCHLMNSIVIWMKIKRHVKLSAVVCLSGQKLFSGGLDTRSIFVLFDLPCFFFQCDSPN